MVHRLVSMKLTARKKDIHLAKVSPRALTKAQDLEHPKGCRLDRDSVSLRDGYWDQDWVNSKGCHLDQGSASLRDCHWDRD